MTDNNYLIDGRRIIIDGGGYFYKAKTVPVLEKDKRGNWWTKYNIYRTDGAPLGKIIAGFPPEQVEADPKYAMLWYTQNTPLGRYLNEECMIHYDGEIAI